MGENLVDEPASSGRSVLAPEAFSTEDAFTPRLPQLLQLQVGVLVEGGDPGVADAHESVFM